MLERINKWAEKYLQWRTDDLPKEMEWIETNEMRVTEVAKGRKRIKADVYQALDMLFRNLRETDSCSNPFANLPKVLRKNKYIILMALRQYAFSVRFLTEKEQDNPKYIFELFKNDESAALDYASERIRNNPDLLVKEAKRQIKKTLKEVIAEGERPPSIEERGEAKREESKKKKKR